jgi:hypothetical protein
MLVKICLIAAALPLLGYLRSSIDGKKPGYLLDSQSILKKWQSENTWAARFSPLFAIFIFLFNLFAWGVYGLVSIVDFIAFIVKKIWWLLSWCWNEVLHPTVFALVRLLWHYLVVFSWKFFSFAFAKIPEGVKKNNILFALKKLLFFGGVSAVAAIVYLLTMNLIVLVIASLIVFYLFQYTVFSTITYYRSVDFPVSPVFPGLTISILWLALSTVSTALMVLLIKFADVYIISGLSVILIQVLLPFAILFGLAFLSTTFYLPAYIKENGPDVDMLKFLKTWLFRLPKLVISQPFQYIGLLILSIIPVLIIILFNAGIRQITEKDLAGWAQHVVVMDYHIPVIKANNIERQTVASEKAQLKLEMDSVEKIHHAALTSTRKELEEAIVLKSNIKDNAIHTFGRKAYVGENQSFSIPQIAACTEFDWKIKDAVSNVEIRKTAVDRGRISGSPVMFHQWKRAGSYIVSLVPRNTCAGAVETSIKIEVIDVPAPPADDTTQIANAAGVDKADNDSATTFMLPENRFFVTREAADYAIDMINSELNEEHKAKTVEMKELDKQSRILDDRTDHLNLTTNENIAMLISKILALLGLVLMAVLYLSVVWTYLVTYHYDMFGFEQEGKHYWINLLDELKSKNPNQPLLGIFVLVVLSLCGYFLITLL